MTKNLRISCVSVLLAWCVGYFVYSLCCLTYDSTLSILTCVANQILLWVIAGCCIYVLLKNKNNEQEKVLNTKRKRIVFWSIIFIALILRLTLFTVVPVGLAPDELSMLYESYSLANFGIDRNGHTWPVYFEAWGSGQNVLLSYLTIPFVKIFGMNAFSARIVSLIISVATLFVGYLLIKKVSNENLALVFMALLAICPWNVMIARWGLESNLFPSMVLFAVYFLVKAIKDNHWWLCLSTMFFGLSLYAYATSYLFVPIFLLAMYIYMFVKKKINWKSFVVANFILMCFAVPLMCFLAVNYGLIKEFKFFGVFTVPKLTILRTSEFIVSFSNLIFFFGVLVFQNDFFQPNTCWSFGMIYIISVPLLIVGLFDICKTLKQKFKEDFSFDILMLLWFGISFIMALFTVSNVNKVNGLWLPMYYFAARGFVKIAFVNKKVFYSAFACFIASTLMFSGAYLIPSSPYHKDYYKIFNDGLIEATEFVENANTNNNEVFVSNEDSWEPYVSVLVGSKTSPIDFYNTVVYQNPTVQLRQVVKFTNYNFGFIGAGFNDGEYYIVKDGDKSVTIPENYQSKKFGVYVVYFK